MHEESSLTINIACVYSVSSQICSLHNGNFISSMHGGYFHSFQISSLAFMITHIQSISISTDPFLYPHVCPVIRCYFIAPPFMSKFMMHQPVEVLPSNLRV